MNRFVWIFVCVLICVSCGKKDQFVVEGEITGAKDKMLYFEHLGFDKVAVLDSVKLTDKGNFKLKQPSLSVPDFYRLRLDGKLINIAVDSTETIKIQANAESFSQDYTVEGSEECKKIKELALLRDQTDESYNKLQKALDAGQITVEDFQQQADSVINVYKVVAKKYIIQDPRSSAAYFALFQQINNMLILDPYDKPDYQAFGAVATNWNQQYPDAERSRHVYDLALQALKVIRGRKPMEYTVRDEARFFDFSLPDINGKMLKLSENITGKVVLLDFTAYQVENSALHNMQLGEIYEKYKDKGFEIFQVSLDNDDHFWKNSAVNLPWLCVRDPQSIYSETAGMYNVKDLPTGFLFNKAGEIVARIGSADDLEKEILKYLK